MPNVYRQVYLYSELGVRLLECGLITALIFARRRDLLLTPVTIAVPQSTGVASLSLTLSPFRRYIFRFIRLSLCDTVWWSHRCCSAGGASRNE